MKKLTPCETCEHVTMGTRKKAPWKWTCALFPRLEGTSAVAPTQWLGHEPYNYCTKINLGYCPLYERRRDGQKELIDRDRKTETEKET